MTKKLIFSIIVLKKKFSLMMGISILQPIKNIWFSFSQVFTKQAKHVFI